MFPKPKKADRVKVKREAKEAALLARAKLRHDAIARSGARCENPECRAPLGIAGCVMDHFLGGNGRRQQQERTETVWMLCLRCNDERTANYPDALTWNRLFATHCAAHGYPVVSHHAPYAEARARRTDG